MALLAGFTSLSHYELGLGYFEEKDYARAKEEFEKALEEGDHVGGACYRLGVIYVTDGDTVEAIKLTVGGKR